MNIEHFVLTRFNVRVGYSEGRHLDEGWLSDRFDLFEAFCLPSVIAQTSGPPRWIVLFDQATPTRFKHRIDQLVGTGHFEPVYIGDFASLDLDRLIRERVESGIDAVITSRIDNDDAYASDYCERVLAAYEPGARVVLNLPEGFLYERATEHLFKKSHDSNPFVSVAEPLCDSARLLTAFGSEHNQWHSVLPVTQVGGGPAWMVVVHEQNVSNAVAGERRVRLWAAHSRFELPGLPRGNRWSASHHLANVLSSYRRIRAVSHR